MRCEFLSWYKNLNIGRAMGANRTPIAGGASSRANVSKTW